ncbi:hypothetical protein VP01_756g3 [Puccinia sorghi]|uniref:Uncharacterized protein n=1 Tax=Puccinia sorghi TaxID=27349 RepID=A0A0L6UC33_9BASI|nr:hypothetical protein VP01_756g3 [Puccinia sorghi]
MVVVLLSFPVSCGKEPLLCIPGRKSHLTPRETLFGDEQQAAGSSGWTAQNPTVPRKTTALHACLDLHFSSPATSIFNYLSLSSAWCYPTLIFLSNTIQYHPFPLLNLVFSNCLHSTTFTPQLPFINSPSESNYSPAFHHIYSSSTGLPLQHSPSPYLDSSYYAMSAINYTMITSIQNIIPEPFNTEIPPPPGVTMFLNALNLIFKVSGVSTLLPIHPATFIVPVHGLLMGFSLLKAQPPHLQQKTWGRTRCVLFPVPNSLKKNLTSWQCGCKACFSIYLHIPTNSLHVNWFWNHNHEPHSLEAMEPSWIPRIVAKWLQERLNNRMGWVQLQTSNLLGVHKEKIIFQRKGMLILNKIHNIGYFSVILAQVLSWLCHCKKKLAQLHAVDMQKVQQSFCDVSKKSTYAKRWSLDGSLAGVCCMSTSETHLSLVVKVLYDLT